MTTVTELDIKELKDLINNRFDEIKTDIKNVETRLTAVETRLTGVETRLTNVETRLTIVENRLEDWKPAILKIPDLAEKIGELKNWRQIALIILTATAGGIIGGLIRVGNFKP